MRYFLVLLGVVLLFTVIFHFIMWNVEGQEHSWATGFYWTLTVMSTLGFGDITFTSDIGRLFTVVVLITGIILLLIREELDLPSPDMYHRVSHRQDRTPRQCEGSCLRQS